MNYSDNEWAQKIQEYKNNSDYDTGVEVSANDKSLILQTCSMDSRYYKNNSDYDTGVEVSANDKILILQTCSMDSRYYKKYYRYNQLVMAKLISVK